MLSVRSFISFFLIPLHYLHGKVCISFCVCMDIINDVYTRNRTNIREISHDPGTATDHIKSGQTDLETVILYLADQRPAIISCIFRNYPCQIAF